jgi:PKD repeat protein
MSAPIAVLTTDVSGMTVNASGAASSSPQGVAIVSYAFDFGDGAVLGPQPIDAVTHLYGAAGTYTVTLTITDARGRTGTDRVRVEVS